MQSSNCILVSSRCVFLPSVVHFLPFFFFIDFIVLVKHFVDIFYFSTFFYYSVELFAISYILLWGLFFFQQTVSNRLTLVGFIKIKLFVSEANWAAEMFIVQKSQHDFVAPFFKES